MMATFNRSESESPSIEIQISRGLLPQTHNTKPVIHHHSLEPCYRKVVKTPFEFVNPNVPRAVTFSPSFAFKC